MQSRATTLLVTAATFLSFATSVSAAPVVNSDFQDGLNNWTTAGQVFVDNEEAVLTDFFESPSTPGGSDVSPLVDFFSNSSSLFQPVATAPGNYNYSFDFFSSLSGGNNQNENSPFPPFEESFFDTFFSSLYFIDDINLFNVDTLSFDSSLALFDLDFNNTNLQTGTITNSSKGEGWRHYQLNFDLAYQYVIPFFELFNLDFYPDSSVRIDNVELSLQDLCPEDATKTAPGVCGCGVAEEDLNENDIVDCREECIGVCNLESADFDEDGDGVSNCDEVEDGTNACDAGSFTPKLAPIACAGANGFYNQVNIAGIVNHQSTVLSVWAEYRDWNGNLLGSIGITVPPLTKRDLIVNDLGLAPDSYGTLCVFTDAEINGAWSGGITVYKQRFGTVLVQNFAASSDFDYALYYPFVNPKKGAAGAPLNTNSLGTDGLGTVANWVRLTDGKPGDGKRLKGVLSYYGENGKLVGTDDVDLADGGRFDFPGHERLGKNEVGLVVFTPKKDSSYFLETTRYFYQGVGSSSVNFFTAFPVPDRPATGETTSALVELVQNQINVIETINANNVISSLTLQFFNASGAVATATQNGEIPAFGSIHRVLDLDSSGALFAQSVNGLNSSSSSIAVSYMLDDNQQLAYAFAPPFVESAGKVQISEFNSFLEQENRFSVFNSTTAPITAVVTIIGYAGEVLNQFDLKLDARETFKQTLDLPIDTYGTILVDSGNDIGLIVKNEVVKPGQYLIPFVAR